MSAPKTCSTCAHRVGPTFPFGKCSKAGLYIGVQREFPTAKCNSDFSGWSPRPGLFSRVKAFFMGWSDKP